MSALRGRGVLALVALAVVVVLLVAFYQFENTRLIKSNEVFDKWQNYIQGKPIANDKASEQSNVRTRELSAQNKELILENNSLQQRNSALQQQINDLNKKVAQQQKQQQQQGSNNNEQIPHQQLPNQGQQQQQQQQQASSQQNNNNNDKQGVPQLHPGVKVVPSKLPEGVKLEGVDCVHLPECKESTVRICLHPTKDDVHVSGTIKRGGLWERGLIHQMDSLLKKDSQLQMVDLGTNIGEYSLWAASLGRPVLSVEMLERNIRLFQKSLELSQLDHLVTLVQNAVFKDRRDLKTLFLKDNIGGTRLNTSSHNDPGGRVDSQKAGVAVHTILLDDLVPLMDKSRPIFMKIDVENSEHQVLQGAHQFFEQLNVKYVQMEWLARTPEEISGIRAFMDKYGYIAKQHVDSNMNADLSRHTIQGDVIFIKQEKNNGAKAF